MNCKIGNILKNVWLAGCLGLMPMACSDDDPALSGNTDLKEISLEGMTENVTLDRENQIVLVQVSESVTNLSAVKLNFTLADGAEALVDIDRALSSGESVDLSHPLKFTVVAPDGSRAHWTVAVTNNNYTLSYGMGYVLTESKSLVPARGEEYSPYVNQYEFTPSPNNNCGPSCAAMAVNWGHSRAKMTAEMARSFNTATERWTPTICQQCISVYGGGEVFAEMTSLPFFYYDENLAELYTVFLKETIDAGRLVVTVVNNADNTYNANPEQHTHRFYQSDDSHMLVYKGYRVVDGVTWIEVYDPAGSGEDAKYADGSWKGENRYYLASDLAKAIANKKIGIVCTVWRK